MDIEKLKKTIDEIVHESVKPLQEQQTNWTTKIKKEEKKVEEKQEKSIRVARMIRALAAAKGDPEKAAWYAKKNFEDEEVVKILSTNPGSSGGFLVPEEYSREIIELLRPQNVVRRLGATVIPMTTGVLNIPKITGGAIASYIGENQTIPANDMHFGQVKLQWKKLAAIVPISNDLIRYGTPEADMVVRDDLVAAVANAEERAFLYGGSTTEPRGLNNWARFGGTVINSDYTNITYETVMSELSKAVLALKEGNARFLRPAWVMAPRTEMYLMTLTDTNGNFVFRSEMSTGKLLGYPYAVTNNVLIMSGLTPDGTTQVDDYTQVFFVDFADTIIGESMRLAIDVSTDASFQAWDGSQMTTINAFTNDQTLIRVIEENDFAMRHEKSVAVIDYVKWGA